MSDPGTGKTRAHLEAFALRRAKGGGKAVVTCPKPLMETAWTEDINEFTPQLTSVIASADDRQAMLDRAKSDQVDILIVNTDATKTLVKLPPSYWRGFDTIIQDECFPAGTLIDTPDGPTPIEMLVAGNMVYTSAGVLPITNTMSRTSSSLVRLELEDGRQIVCTETHPIATSDGWRQARTVGRMLLVQLDLHKLDQSRADFLWPHMFAKRILAWLFQAKTKTNIAENIGLRYWQVSLEQGLALVAGREAKVEFDTSAFGTHVQRTWRQWEDGTGRKSSAGDVTADVDLQLAHTDRKTTRFRLPGLLQSRFRQSEEESRTGGRRWLACIAQTLGCQERFIAGVARVVRVSRIKQSCPSPVFNFQVDGPHDYSVAGTLVHNCSSYKHRTSQRSKAANKLRHYFEYRNGLTGTPNPNSVVELWHQALLLDDGKRLGTNFYKFQSQVCAPELPYPGAPHQYARWVDKPGIERIVAELLRDITVRHEFEQCMDIPKHTVRRVRYHPPAALMKHYKTLERDALLELESGDITAVHKAALRTKLLQCASGAIYGGDRSVHVLDNTRNELVVEFAEEVDHSLIFYNWEHQRDGVAAELDKREMKYAIVTSSNAKKVKDQFQDGRLRTLLLHPETGAHGLTLTRGRRAIFASPFDRADYFKQAKHRIYRGGQEHKTETVMIEARGTIEGGVYERTEGKGKRMDDLLSLIKET